jgi:hypothetical protein
METPQMAPTLLFCRVGMTKTKTAGIRSFTLDPEALARKTQTVLVHATVTRCLFYSNCPLMQSWNPDQTEDQTFENRYNKSLQVDPCYRTFRASITSIHILGQFNQQAACTRDQRIF